MPDFIPKLTTDAVDAKVIERATVLMRNFRARPPLPDMPKAFKVGDHVKWNSEAGRVGGTIIKVHRKDANYKGHSRHATGDEPQYEIKSDKTDHIAMHKGSALKRIG